MHVCVKVTIMRAFRRGRGCCSGSGQNKMISPLLDAGFAHFNRFHVILSFSDKRTELARARARCGRRRQLSRCWPTLQPLQRQFHGKTSFQRAYLHVS